MDLLQLLIGRSNEAFVGNYGTFTKCTKTIRFVNTGIWVSQGIGNHVPVKDLLAFLTVIKYDRVSPLICVLMSDNFTFDIFL